MPTPGEITLYEYWRSSASYRVRIALNLKGLRYRSVAVDIPSKAHQAHAHLARDPLGRVPVLAMDGLILTQSLAMLEYLEETRPGPALLPAPGDAAGRARVRTLALLVAADIHPLGNPSAMVHVDALLSNQPGKSDGALDKSAWQRHFIGQGLRAFETHLAHGPAGKFCHGDTPSMADCCLLPQLYNAQRWNTPLDDYPRIRAVAEAAGKLESFRNAHPDMVRAASGGG